ncbi:MAG: TIGR04283 family arsenosugar biosynthesis glycosyltransferase [Armatimonadetes bacterium]|nr:TIGR04283 family arsenosugar biosynthesis glycosyltransferase [Armatimonadota bacterium]
MLSLVIPTFNEAELLPSCLLALGRPAGVEIVVADGGSSDDTVALAHELGARVAACDPGPRAEQLNQAVAECRGEAILFLHADARLPAHGLTAVEQCLQDRPEVVAGCFTMRLDDARRGYRAIAWCGDVYCRVTRTLFGDRAMFVRREAFERVGGFRPLAVMEEVDLGRRLRRVGKLAMVSGPVISSARQFHRQGAVRLVGKILVACTAFELGVPAEVIRQFYYGVPPPAVGRALARHSTVAVGAEPDGGQ